MENGYTELTVLRGEERGRKREREGEREREGGREGGGESVCVCVRERMNRDIRHSLCCDISLRYRRLDGGLELGIVVLEGSTGSPLETSSQPVGWIGGRDDRMNGTHPLTTHLYLPFLPPSPSLSF